MTDVVDLRPAVPEPNSDVVEKLRRLLQLAETGDIRGIAYGYVLADGTLAHGWTFDRRVNSADVIACTTILQHAVITDARHTERPR